MIVYVFKENECPTIPHILIIARKGTREKAWQRLAGSRSKKKIEKIKKFFSLQIEINPANNTRGIFGILPHS